MGTVHPLGRISTLRLLQDQGVNADFPVDRVRGSQMRKFALLIAPWLLLASTTTVFRRLAARFGPKGGYFRGFLFYWIFWCLLFPMWVLGPRRLPGLFRAGVAPSSRPNRSDLLL